MIGAQNAASESSPEGAVQGAPGSAGARPAEPVLPVVAVLDDDPSMLSSMARLLRMEHYAPVTYSSPGVFLAGIASLDPSCVVVDLAMPDLSGLEVQRQLAVRRVNCPVVFVTGHGDIRTSVQAMQGGAVDFLTKPFEAAELLDAIGRAISKSRHTREQDDRLALVRRRAASLTSREREVFTQVVAGLLNKQIAANLLISEKTVKVHRGRVMRKMAVRSVAQLVRAAECLEADGASGFSQGPISSA